MSLFTTSRVSKQDILRIADQIIPQHATTTAVSAAGRAGAESSLDSAFSLLSSLSTASAHESLPPALAMVMTQLGPDWQMDLIGRCLTSAQTLVGLQQYRKALAYVAAALSLPIFRYNLELRLPVSLLTAHAEEMFAQATHACLDASPTHSASAISLPSSVTLPIAQCPFDAAPALCSPLVMHLHGYDFAGVFGVRRKQRVKACDRTTANADQIAVHDGAAMTDAAPVAATHKAPRAARATPASSGAPRTRTPAGAPGKAKLDWSLLTEVRDLCAAVYSHVLHHDIHTPTPYPQVAATHADGHMQATLDSLLALARSSPAPLATLPLSATPLLAMHAPEPVSSSSAVSSTTTSSSSSSSSPSSAITGWLQPLAPYTATPAACAALASALSLFEVCVAGMLRRNADDRRDAQLLVAQNDSTNDAECANAGAAAHPVAALGGSMALTGVLTATLPVLRLSLLCARLICTRSLPVPAPPVHATGYITVARASPLFAAVPALLAALRREVVRRAAQLRDDAQEAATEGTRQRLPSKRTAAPSTGASTAPAAAATPFASALVALAAQTDAVTTASVAVVIAPVRAEHVRLHSLRHCGCLFCEAVAVCGELRRRGLPLSARGVEVFVAGEYAQLLRDDAPTPASAPISEAVCATADDAHSPPCGMLGRALLDRRLQQGRDALVPELATGVGAVTITCCHPLLARLARPQHALEPFLQPATPADAPYSAPHAPAELLPPLSVLAHDLLAPLAAPAPATPLTPRWTHWLPPLSPHAQHAHAAPAPLSPIVHLLHAVPHHPLPLPPLASLLRACTDTRMLTTFASAAFAALPWAAACGAAHMPPAPLTATIDAAFATLALQRVAALQTPSGDAPSRTHGGQLSARRAGSPSRSHSTHALVLDAGHTRVHPPPLGAVAMGGAVGSAAVCAAQLSLLNTATALAIAPPSAQVPTPAGATGDAASGVSTVAGVTPDLTAGGIVDTTAFDAVRNQLGRRTSCVPPTAPHADPTLPSPLLSSLLATGCAVAVAHGAAGATVTTTSFSTELPSAAAAVVDEENTETAPAADWEADVSALQSRWCTGLDSSATEHVLSRAAVRAIDAASTALVARAGQHALALAHAHAAQLAVPVLTVTGSRADTADTHTSLAQGTEQRGGAGVPQTSAAVATSLPQPTSGRAAPALPSLPQEALITLQAQRAQLVGALADPVAALVETAVLTHQEVDEAADLSSTAMSSPVALPIAPLAALADAAPASSLPALAVRAVLLSPPSQESLALFARAARRTRTLLASLHPLLRHLAARLRAITAAPLSPAALAAFAAILLDHRDALARALAAIDPLLLVAALAHAHVVAGVSGSADVSIPGGAGAPHSSDEASLLAVAGPALADAHTLARLLHDAQAHAAAKLASPVLSDSAPTLQHSLQRLSSAVAASPVLAFARALAAAHSEYAALAATHAHPSPPPLLLSRAVEPADAHGVQSASSLPHRTPSAFLPRAPPSASLACPQPNVATSMVRASRRARAAAASIPVLVSTLRPRVAAQDAEEHSHEQGGDVPLLFASVAGLARACGMGVREPFLFYAQTHAGDVSARIPSVSDAMMDEQKDVVGAASVVRKAGPVPHASSLSGTLFDCVDVSVHTQTPALEDHSPRAIASDADEGLFSDSSQGSQGTRVEAAEGDDSLLPARTLAAAGEESADEDGEEGENSEEEDADDADDMSKSAQLPTNAANDMGSDGEDEDTDDEGLYSPASPRTITPTRVTAVETDPAAGADTFAVAVDAPSVAMADTVVDVAGDAEAAKTDLPTTIEAAAPLPPEVVPGASARGAVRRLSRRQAALAVRADRDSSKEKESVAAVLGLAEDEQLSVRAREVARKPQPHVQRHSPASASGSSPLPRAALGSALLAMTPAQALAAAYLPLVTFHNAPSIVQPLPSALLVHAVHISALLSGPHESVDDGSESLVALPNGAQLPLQALQRARRAMRAAMGGQQRHLEAVQAARSGGKSNIAEHLGADITFPSTDLEVDVNVDTAASAVDAHVLPAAVHRTAVRALQWLLVDAPAITPGAVDALFACSTHACVPVSPTARTLTAHCAAALVQLSAVISWHTLAPVPVPSLLALVPHALTLLLPAPSLPVLPQLSLAIAPTVLARALDAFTPQHPSQTDAHPARACCVWLLGSLAALLAELLCGALLDPIEGLSHMAPPAAAAASPASLAHHRALTALRGSPAATLAAMRASYGVAQHALQMLASLATVAETFLPGTTGSMADTDARSAPAHTHTATTACLSRLAAALRARILLLTLRTGLPAQSLSIHATISGKHSIPAVQVTGGPSLEEKQALLAQLARVLCELPQRSLALPHLSPALLGCPNVPADAAVARAGASASAKPHTTESLASAYPPSLVLTAPLLRVCAAELAHHRALAHCDALLQQQALAHATEHAALAHALAQNHDSGAPAATTDGAVAESAESASTNANTPALALALTPPPFAVDPHAAVLASASTTLLHAARARLAAPAPFLVSRGTGEVAGEVAGEAATTSLSTHPAVTSAQPSPHVSLAATLGARLDALHAAAPSPFSSFYAMLRDALRVAAPTSATALPVAVLPMHLSPALSSLHGVYVASHANIPAIASSLLYSPAAFAAGSAAPRLSAPEATLLAAEHVAAAWAGSALALRVQSHALLATCVADEATSAATTTPVGSEADVDGCMDAYGDLSLERSVTARTEAALLRRARVDVRNDVASLSALALLVGAVEDGCAAQDEDTAKATSTTSEVAAASSRAYGGDVAAREDALASVPVTVLLLAHAVADAAALALQLQVALNTCPPLPLLAAVDTHTADAAQDATTVHPGPADATTMDDAQASTHSAEWRSAKWRTRVVTPVYTALLDSMRCLHAPSTSADVPLSAETAAGAIAPPSAAHLPVAPLPVHTLQSLLARALRCFHLLGQLARVYGTDVELWLQAHCRPTPGQAAPSRMAPRAPSTLFAAILRGPAWRQLQLGLHRLFFAAALSSFACSAAAKERDIQRDEARAHLLAAFARGSAVAGVTQPFTSGAASPDASSVGAASQAAPARARDFFGAAHGVRADGYVSADPEVASLLWARAREEEALSTAPLASLAAQLAPGLACLCVHAQMEMRYASQDIVAVGASTDTAHASPSSGVPASSPLAELAPSLLAFAALLPSAAYALTPYLTERAGVFPVRLPTLPAEPPQSTAPPPPHPLLLAAADEVAVRLLAASLALAPPACSPTAMALSTDPRKLIAVARAHPAALLSLRTASPPRAPTALLASPVVALPSPLLAHPTFQFHMLRALTLPHAALPLLHHVRLLTSAPAPQHPRALAPPRVMTRSPSLSPLLPLLLSSATTGAMDEFAALAYPLRAHALDMPSPFAAAKSLAWATHTAVDDADGALACVGRWLGDADWRNDHFVATFTPARALAALSDAAATHAQAHAAVSRTVIVGAAHALVLLWLEQQQQLASLQPSPMPPSTPSSSRCPVAEALQGLVASGILAGGAARALHALVLEVLGDTTLAPANAADTDVPFLLRLAALVRARDAQVLSPVLVGWLLAATGLPAHVTAVSTAEHPALESLLCCLRTHVAATSPCPTASPVSAPVHPAAVAAAAVGAGVDVVHYMLADTEDSVPATTLISLHPTTALPMRPPSNTLWRLPLSRCRPARVDGEPYAAALTWPSALVTLLRTHLPAALGRDFTLPAIAATGFDTDDDLHHSLQLFSPAAPAPCASLSSASAPLHPALARSLLNVTRQHYALFATPPSRTAAPPLPSLADAHADFLQHQLHACLFGDVANAQRQLADALAKAAAAEREAAAAAASSASAPSVVRAQPSPLPGARGPIAWRTSLAYVEAALRTHVHSAAVVPEDTASDACGEGTASAAASLSTDSAAAAMLSYFFPASLAAIVAQLPLRGPCDLATLATPHTTLLGYLTTLHMHTHGATHVLPPHPLPTSASMTITVSSTALPCAPPSSALLAAARCVLDHLALNLPRAPLLHRLALATHPTTLLAHLVDAMPGATSEHPLTHTATELALCAALATVPARTQGTLTLTPLFDACSLVQLAPALSTPAVAPGASSDTPASHTAAPSQAVSAAALLLAWLVARNADADAQPALPYLLMCPGDAHSAAAHALLPLPVPFTPTEVVIALQLLASELARLAPQVAESVTVLATLSARKRAALYKGVDTITSFAPAFLTFALALPPRVLPAELAPAHTLPLALRCLALVHHCHSVAFAIENCPPDGEMWATDPFVTAANAAATPALPPLGGVALPTPPPLRPYSWPRWMRRQAYMPCLLERYRDLPGAEVSNIVEAGGDDEGTAFFVSVRHELYKELDACTLLPSLARAVASESADAFDDTCVADAEHGGAGQSLDGAGWADQLYALAADVLMLCLRGDLPELLHSRKADDDAQSPQLGAAVRAYPAALARVHAVEVSDAPASLSPLARELLVSTLTHQLALAHVHTHIGTARSPALAELRDMLRAITAAAAGSSLTPALHTSQLIIVPVPRAASPLARCLTPVLALAPSPAHAYALACHALRGARALSSAVRSQLLAAIHTASNPDHHSFSALLASVQIRLDSIVPQLSRLLELYRDAMVAARLALACALHGWSSTQSALSACDAADAVAAEESVSLPSGRAGTAGKATALVPAAMVSHAMLLLQNTRAELHATASSHATLLHDCALLVHEALRAASAEGSTGSVSGPPPLLLTRVLTQGYSAGVSFEVDLAAAVALLPVADSTQAMRDGSSTAENPSQTSSAASLLLARSLSPAGSCVARALAVPEPHGDSSSDTVSDEAVLVDGGVMWDGPVDTTLVPAFHSDGSTASELWPTLARHPAAPALAALPVFSTDILLERVRAARPHARVDALADAIAALAALAEESHYRFSPQAAGPQEATTLSGLLAAHGFPVVSAPDAIIVDDITYTVSATPWQPTTSMAAFPLFGPRGVAADIAAGFICVAGWGHCGAAAASALLELQRCQSSMLLLVKTLPVVVKWLLAPHEFVSDGAPSADHSVATTGCVTPSSSSGSPRGATADASAAFAEAFDVDEELAELGLNAFMDLEIDLSRTAQNSTSQPASAATELTDEGNAVAEHPLIAANTLSGLSLPSPLALHRACALSFSLAIRHLEHFSGNATNAATASLFQCASPAALAQITSAAGEAALLAVSPIAPPHQRASTHLSLCVQLLQAALALVDVRWSQHAASSLATVMHLLPVSKLRLADKTAKALPVYVSQVMALLCGHWHLHLSMRLEAISVCVLLATVAPLPHLARTLPLARAALDRYPTVADAANAAVHTQTDVCVGVTACPHSHEAGHAAVPAVFITPAQLHAALDPHLPLLILSIAHINTVLRAPPSVLPTTASSSTSYSSSSSPASSSLSTLPSAPPGPSFAAIHYFRVRTVLLSCPGLSSSLASQQLLQQRILLLLATPVRRLWHQALFDVAIDSHAHSAAVRKWLAKHRDGTAAVDGAPSSSLQPTRPLLASLPLPPAPLLVHALVARARLLACTQWLTNDRSMRKWTRDYNIDALTWGVSPLINDVTDADGSSHAFLTISCGTAAHPPPQWPSQATAQTTGQSSFPPTGDTNDTPLCCAVAHDVHALPPVEKLLLPVFATLRAQLRDADGIEDDSGQSGVSAAACANGSNPSDSAALQMHMAEARRSVCRLLHVGEADNPDAVWARFFSAIVCQRRLNFRHARVAGLSHDAVRASACEALSSTQWSHIMRRLKDVLDTQGSHVDSAARLPSLTTPVQDALVRQVIAEDMHTCGSIAAAALLTEAVLSDAEVRRATDNHDLGRLIALASVVAARVAPWLPLSVADCMQMWQAFCVLQLPGIANWTQMAVPKPHTGAARPPLPAPTLGLPAPALPVPMASAKAKANRDVSRKSQAPSQHAVITGTSDLAQPAPKSKSKKPKNAQENSIADVEGVSVTNTAEGTKKRPNVPKSPQATKKRRKAAAPPSATAVVSIHAPATQVPQPQYQCTTPFEHLLCLADVDEYLAAVLPPNASPEQQAMLYANGMTHFVAHMRHVAQVRAPSLLPNAPAADVEFIVNSCVQNAVGALHSRIEARQQ